MSDIEKPQPFDPSAAVNAIRDKIRMMMLDIIPTEQWDALIKAEMQAFMTDHVEPPRYMGDKPTVAPARFKTIVRELLEVEAKKYVKELLSSPEWQTANYGGSPEYAGDAVKAFLADKGPQILTEFMNAVMMKALSAALSGMRYNV